MKFSQVCALFSGTAAVHGMVLSNENQLGFNDTEVVHTVAQIYPYTNVTVVETVSAVETEPPIVTYESSVATVEPATPVAVALDDSTKEKVVVAMKDVMEGVLDAFRDFGDISGVGFESLLADSGYVVEVTPEKRKRSLKSKRFLGFLPGLINVVRAVLTGVSTITGVLASVQPQLAFVGEAAVAINGLLGVRV